MWVYRIYFFSNMVRDFASYISDSLDDILPNESRLSIFDFANIQSTAECSYHTPENISELIPILEQNIESEECAIRHYQRIIDLSRDLGDYATERMIKDIQADEYDHLSGLNDFLADLRS